MAELATQTITSMTAIFTPPPDCARSWTFEDEFYNHISGGLLVQNAESFSVDSTCFPPDFNGNGRAPSSIQVYSPGACPKGYQTPGQFQNDGTTTGICCPSSFSYGSVYSTIFETDTTSVLFMGCISSYSGTTTVSARGNDSAIPISGSDITMWAQPVSIEFQQRDLSLFGVSTTISDNSPSQTTSGGSISNTAVLPGSSPSGADSAQTSGAKGPESSSTDPPSADDSGLSTGATAGIAVAASVIGIGLIAGLVFFVLRKRRNARRQVSSGGGAGGAYYAQDSKEPLREPQWERRELDAGPASEYRPELDGRESGLRNWEGREVRPKQRAGEVSELA